MKMLLPILALLLPTVAQSAGWSSGQDRGIPFYNIDEAGLNLTVACDPNGTYDPPQQYIQATIAGKPVTGRITLSTNGETAMLPFDAGTSFRQAVTHKTWDKALLILGSSAGFIFADKKIDTRSEAPSQFISDCR